MNTFETGMNPEITKFSKLVESEGMENKADEKIEVHASDGTVLRIPRADYDKFLEDYRQDRAN